MFNSSSSPSTARSIMAGQFSGGDGRLPIRSRFGRVYDQFHSFARAATRRRCRGWKGGSGRCHGRTAAHAVARGCRRRARCCIRAAALGHCVVQGRHRGERRSGAHTWSRRLPPPTHPRQPRPASSLACNDRQRAATARSVASASRSARTGRCCTTALRTSAALQVEHAVWTRPPPSRRAQAQNAASPAASRRR